MGKLKARKFAEIPISRFHVFRVPGQLTLRPHIKIEDGVLKKHRFPWNHFYYWRNPTADNDLVLFLGMEPNLYWEEYAIAILDMPEGLAVTRIYILGGVLDRTSHTREPGVSCYFSPPRLREQMRQYAVSFGGYEGPGSFGTTLHHLCQEWGGR